MISLRQSRFTDILPENLASQVEVQALAYAVGNQIAQLVPLADGVRVYAAVDTMDHAVLDYLAVELRIEGYRQSQSLEVKRRLVKQAMAVTAKLGTAGAVRQTTEAIYDYAQVQEWFEYGGEPYHFRLLMGGVGASVEEINQFSQSIERVKNVRSVLESIVFREQSTSTIYTGIAARQGDRYRLAPVVCSGYRQNPVYCGIAPRQGDRYQLRPLSCGPLRRDPVRVGMVMRQADKIIVKQVTES